MGELLPRPFLDMESLETKTLTELKAIAIPMLLKTSFEHQCEVEGDKRLTQTWLNFINSCRRLFAKADRPLEPKVDRHLEPKVDRPLEPKASFVNFVKPYLHHQPHFEEPGNKHFANIYNAWETFWNADTFSKLDIPYWECEVYDGSLAYVRTGLALHAIRLKLSYGNKNWKQEFEAFCKSSPIGSVAYARKIIQAAKTTIDLINLGFSKLPSCISQALPLAKFSPDRKTDLPDEIANESLGRKWQEVLDLAPEGRVTTAHVQEVVTGVEEDKPATVKIRKYKKNLAEEARARGISQQELLEEILAERYAPEPPEPPKEPEEPEEPEEPIEHAPEQLEILDECDRFLGNVAAGEQSVRAIGIRSDSRSPPGGDATKM